MTDAALRRADELLSELIELVETARALPMSSSCVVPREQVLDLLDALRETMPPEMAEARMVVARQQAIEEDARAAGDELLDRARAEGDRIVHAARVEAHEASEAARAEAGALVSASSVHAAATIEAQRLREDAEEYSERMRTQARTYADRTLADLATLLGDAARTAENGRRALQERPEGEDAEPMAAAADSSGFASGAPGSGDAGSSQPGQPPAARSDTDQDEAGAGRVGPID